MVWFSWVTVNCKNCKIAPITVVQNTCPTGPESGTTVDFWLNASLSLWRDSDEYRLEPHPDSHILCKFVLEISINHKDKWSSLLLQIMNVVRNAVRSTDSVFM